MDIANIFIIYHINRKNTKESNAGVLYIEKKLKDAYSLEEEL